jgi:transposase
VPQSRYGRPSRVTEAVRDQLRVRFADQLDKTLAELSADLQTIGVPLRRSRISQILQQMSLGRKKTLHAAERDSEANRKRREEFLETIQAIAPEKLIFLDESGVTTEMTRQWGRAPRGQRIDEAMPQGHREVLTTLGAMSLRGMDAVMTVPSATDGEVFRAYVGQVLCPKLQPGDVVVMDNLSAHKVSGIREKIEACHAQVLYLPPYSPDLNPIEKAWSKFKQFLRAAKARSKEALDQAHLLHHSFGSD